MAGIGLAAKTQKQKSGVIFHYHYLYLAGRHFRFHFWSLPQWNGAHQMPPTSSYLSTRSMHSKWPCSVRFRRVMRPVGPPLITRMCFGRMGWGDIGAKWEDKGCAPLVLLLYSLTARRHPLSLSFSWWCWKDAEWCHAWFDHESLNCSSSFPSWILIAAS